MTRSGFETGVAMDLVDLSIFKAVAEEGGVARAARKLHRVPSSVTSRIQQLEASVGAKLFVRSKQRLHVSFLQVDCLWRSLEGFRQNENDGMTGAAVIAAF